MKNIRLYIAVLFSTVILGGSVAEAQTTQPQQKKGWSKKAKGAAIGGAGGAVAGRVIGGGTKGTIIGAAAGTAAGGAIGRKKDRKKDPARYEQYADREK
ncbi:YMGG-like glycine zipper-containing protein [Adhaeribacter aquaticus]|uniref:YMGG-like glycine zipper-containing protein n=1 Tax=Adhaeribacter aquaticus TaxID=299567 RepID=UPI000407E783|nr:YMGG-like glycine zipper-containing protein [Adhaeribacter aquaticus]